MFGAKFETEMITNSSLNERTYISDILPNNLTKIFGAVVAVLFCVLWLVGDRGCLSGIPGPRALPVFGNLFQLLPQPHIALNQMWKRYGDVYQIRMGSLRAVVINGVELVRKAYTYPDDAFGGRPDFLAFRYIQKGDSLTFGRPKPEWYFHKKLARTAMRRYLKHTDRDHIKICQNEAQMFVHNLIKAGKDGAFNPNKIMENAVRSLTFSLILGGTSENSDNKEYNELMAALLQANDLGMIGMIPDIFPWSRPFFKRLGKYDQFRDVTDNLERKVQDIIENHKQTMDPLKTRDFTDSFLQTSNSVEEYPNNLDSAKFVLTVLDLLGGSESTLSSVVAWAVYLLSSSPETQMKAQEEIDNVIGKEDLPHVSDRPQMPYMQAVILEIIRCGSILPISLPHCTTKDVSFAGYEIPKDTLVMFNLFSVVRDENHWERPCSFDPSRFLNADTGRADLGMKAKFLPFGAGRRRCLGQLIAQDELFIFFTTLLQKCTLSLSTGEKIDFNGTLALSLMPKPYQINVCQRM